MSTAAVKSCARHLSRAVSRVTMALLTTGALLAGSAGTLVVEPMSMTTSALVPVLPAQSGPDGGPGGGSGPEPGGGDAAGAPVKKDDSGSGGGSGSADSGSAEPAKADGGAPKPEPGGQAGQQGGDEPQPAPDGKPAAEDPAPAPQGPQDRPEETAAPSAPTADPEHTPAAAPRVAPADAPAAAPRVEPADAPAAAPSEPEREPAAAGAPPRPADGPIAPPAAGAQPTEEPRAAPIAGAPNAEEAPPAGVPQRPDELTVGAKPVDPHTGKVLEDYRQTLPPDARGKPLDFSTTQVGADRRTELVRAEGGDVVKVDDMVRELGGENPTVTQTPMVVRDEQGNFGTMSLFKVKGADGQDYLVDGAGAKYTSTQDYLENNEFSDKWTMVRSKDPAAAGPQELVSGTAHVKTTGDKIGEVADEVARSAQIVGGGAVLAGAAAEVVTVGGATPVAGPVIAVGGAMELAGSGWLALRGGDELINRFQHGRSLSITDPKAGEAYAQIAGGILGAGVAGAGTAVNRTARDLATARSPDFLPSGASGARLPGHAPEVADGVHSNPQSGRAIVDSGKYDYLFDKVESNPHNSARSAQNAAQLNRVGVFDNSEGRVLLERHFDEVVSSDSNIMRTFRNEHGEFQVRDSLFAGPRGFVHFESAWQVTSDGLRMTTVIPKGGP